MTTTQFMMTPALMELYAFLDAWQVDDSGHVTDTFNRDNPTLRFYATTAQIPMSETLDPTSPSYMHWTNPEVPNAGVDQAAGCATDPLVYGSNGSSLHFLILGALDNRGNPSGGPQCNAIHGSEVSPQFTATDYTAWRMVTVRPPRLGEHASLFYDLPALRAGSELVLTIPRVGFFSTPAFFANWQTNTSNQMRATANQMLIVATGAAVDGTDPTVPSSTPGLDAVHAADAQCASCHKTLDPTRSILAATYSWNYHVQTDPGYSAQKGLFAFQGVQRTVATVQDLGATLAAHPLFAPAWVQKLCFYVDSKACDATDPEFSRIVSLFRSSGHSWKSLVKELLSSPLTTNARPLQTSTADGALVAVARRDHLCAALNNRLGFADVCGLDARTKAAEKTAVADIVAGLPSDGYGRGAVVPAMPNDPSLFFRAGTENICATVAAMVVDPTAPQDGVKRWSSAEPAAAIADFVGIVMALTPSDPRAAQALEILQAHFADAQQQGESASDALRSTFVVACLAPSAVAIGL